MLASWNLARLAFEVLLKFRYELDPPRIHLGSDNLQPFPVLNLDWKLNNCGFCVAHIQSLDGCQVLSANMTANIVKFRKQCPNHCGRIKHSYGLRYYLCGYGRFLCAFILAALDRKRDHNVLQGEID